MNSVTKFYQNRSIDKISPLSPTEKNSKNLTIYPIAKILERGGGFVAMSKFCTRSRIIIKFRHRVIFIIVIIIIIIIIIIITMRKKKKKK